MQVDNTDIRIIIELLKNARVPFRRIAKELSIGESTVYSRISKLISAGILKGFTVLLDYEKIGLYVEAFLEVKVEPKSIRDVVSKLSKIDGVAEVYEVSGEYPILVKVVAPDNEELSKVIDMIGQIDGVRDLSIKYVLKRHYEAEKPDSILRVLIKGMSKIHRA